MKKIWSSYINASLILKISVALILGIAVGVVFGEDAAVLAPLGDLLIKLLSFLIIPLVLFTLIVGVNQTKLSNLGSMGGKVFLYYALTSAFAIIVGLTVASLFDPGTGLSLNPDQSFDVPENPGIISVLLSIVPSNIVTAFSEMNLLGIIFTAFAFGIAISALRTSAEHAELGEHLYKVVEGLNEATFKIMNVVLQYVPIGIFAIIAKTIGNQGLDTILSLGNMIAVLYIALLVQVAIYVIFLVFFKVSPKEFFSKARTPMITAFATQSSSGTLPLTLNAANGLGLPKSLYGFSLPLGATINMDGAAIRIAISAVFAANVVGAPLSFTDMLMIVIVGTLATIGTAGVPGAGIVMIATVFAQVGLPMETVALLTAVDALVGMGATALNVTGDLVGATIIGRKEKSK
ncbi:dicarboxylate/amino acid:cation symporter [Pseudalkalibacillus hwajinpoensis]|uniref:Dicarboxylate/amino acid:cation symporter n=1 Tax=Guptibacillus hwajinpoensis TaxID=208199 RepID=A0A4U1MJ13_9BACL|nr:dicarboxylate/amino acid:cation symporter [Pseudalkalibacillus hwajinpoensis]TKD70476.1 dicarboxylate/amino acid:cation symporter [Pseudalkalibacillus hwajinpoensis]